MFSQRIAQFPRISSSEELGLWMKSMLVCNSVLPLTSSVTWDKQLNLSKSQFPHVCIYTMVIIIDFIVKIT